MAEVTKAELDDFKTRLGRVEKVSSIGGAFGVVGLALLGVASTGVVWLAVSLGELREAKGHNATEIVRIDKAIDSLSNRLLHAETGPRVYGQYNSGFTIVDGTIEKIDRRDITVALREIGKWECHLGSNTIVKIDGKTAERDALKKGMEARFYLADKKDDVPILVEVSTNPDGRIPPSMPPLAMPIKPPPPKPGA